MTKNGMSLKYIIAVGVLGALSLASMGFGKGKPSPGPAGCPCPGSVVACYDGCAGLKGKDLNYCEFQCNKTWCYLVDPLNLPAGCF